MSRETLLATNMISNLLIRILNMALALVAVRMLVDNVGNEHYGIYVLGTTLLGYFSLFGLGMPGALLKFIPDRKAKNDYEGLGEIISSSYVFYFGVGLVIFIFLAAISLFGIHLFRIKPESFDTARRVLLMVGLWAIVSWPMQIYGHVLMGLQKFYLLNFAIGIQSILCNGLYVVISLLHLPIECAILTLSLSQTVLYVITKLLVKRELPNTTISFHNFKISALKSLFSFSFWVLIMQMAVLLIYQANQLIISLFLSMGAITIYAIQTMPLMGIREINGIALSASTPAVADAHALDDKGFIKELLFKGTRINMILVVGLITVIIAMSRQIIYVWMGKDHAQYYYLCQLLLLSYAFSVMFSLVGNIIFGMGGVKTLGILAISGAMLTLIISIILVKPLGLFGLVLGNLIAQILVIPVMAIVFFNKINMSFARFFKEVAVKVYFCAIIFGLILWKASSMLGDKPKLIPAISFAGMGVIFVIGGMFIFACPNEDRKKIIQLIIKGSKNILNFR